MLVVDDETGHMASKETGHEASEETGHEPMAWPPGSLEIREVDKTLLTGNLLAFTSRDLVTQLVQISLIFPMKGSVG
jgi:hypothetical protein